MTERAELLFRDLLLQLRGRASAHAVEAALPGLLAARLECAEAVLPNATMQRHVETIRARTVEARNGHAPWQLGLRPRLPVSLRYALPIGAALVAVVVLLLVLLNQVGVQDKDRLIVQPGPRGSTPDKVPVPSSKEPLVKDDLPENKEGPIRRRKQRPDGLLAQRVQVGAFGSVTGAPTWRMPHEPTDHFAMPNEPVYAGATIKTGDSARLEIVLRDGSRVTLDFNTELRIAALATNRPVAETNDVDLGLEWGRLVARVVPQSDAGTFVVRTPVATAEVLGTVFSLAVTGTRTDPSTLKANLQVEEGEVRLSNSRGFRRVPAFFESTATAGAAPTEPKRLSTLGSFTLTGSHMIAITTSRLSAADARFAIEGRSTRSRARRLRGLPQEGRARLFELTEALLNGELDRSESGLQDLARAHRHSEVLNALGVALEMRDRIAVSIDSYKSAIEMSPGTALYHFNLGMALRKIGNLERSAEELLLASELDSELVQAVTNLSLALALLGKMEAALRFLLAAEPLLGREHEYWSMRSRVSLLAGRQRDAFDSAVRLVYMAPRSDLGWHALAEVHHDTGRLLEAEACCRKAIAIKPDVARYRNLLASVLNDQKRHWEAKREFLEAIRIEPAHPLCYVNLGRVYWDMGELAEAESMYRRAIELDSNLASAFQSLAAVLVRTGRLKEAIPEFERAIRLDPDKPMLRHGLAHALMSLGRKEEAFRTLERGLLLDPRNAVALNMYGALLNERDRKREAAQVFERAIAAGSTEHFPYYSLAEIRFSTGDIDVARREARAGIKFLPKDGSAHNWVAGFLKRLGLIAEAGAVYQAGVEMRTSDAPLMGNFGTFLLEQNRLAEAEAMMRRATAADPNLLPARLNLGLLLYWQSRYEEAEAEYRAALEIGPNSASALSGIALCLAGRRANLDEALDLVRKAVAAAPDNPMFVANLGVVHRERGELDDALRSMQRAIDLDRESKFADRVWCQIGQVYELKREIGKAKEAYLNALHLNPSRKEAAEALKRLAGSEDKDSPHR